MSYTTVLGKASRTLKAYQMARLALQVLKQWFGQNALVIEGLKSSVVSGP